MAKAAKKPTAKQLAARKKFAAMAKARAKKKVVKKVTKKATKKKVAKKKTVKKSVYFFDIEYSKSGKSWKVFGSEISREKAFSLAKRLAKANPDYYIRVTKK